MEEEITTFTKDGDRVLLFAKYAGTDLKHGLTGEVIPLGFVVLANPIRENAKQTFEYFNNQGVAIKVISGDNPGTVSEVALQAGIPGAENYVMRPHLIQRRSLGMQWNSTLSLDV